MEERTTDPTTQPDILNGMTIRADEVRFSSRDVRLAIGGAVLLGALFGCVVLILPTIGSKDSGSVNLFLFLLLCAALIGSIFGLGAAAGAGIAYAFARARQTRRVVTFTLLMAVGSGVAGAIGVALLVSLGSNGGGWLPPVGGLFAASAIPVAVIVPLAFSARARQPLPVPTVTAPGSAPSAAGTD